MVWGWGWKETRSYEVEGEEGRAREGGERREASERESEHKWRQLGGLSRPRAARARPQTQYLISSICSHLGWRRQAAARAGRHPQREGGGRPGHAGRRRICARPRRQGRHVRVGGDVPGQVGQDESLGGEWRDGPVSVCVCVCVCVCERGLWRGPPPLGRRRSCVSCPSQLLFFLVSFRRAAAHCPLLFPPCPGRAAPPGPRPPAPPAWGGPAGPPPRWPRPRGGAIARSGRAPFGERQRSGKRKK